MKRDLVCLSDFSIEECRALFARTRELKDARTRREPVTTLAGRTLLCIFEKASTRTRVSFEAAMAQLGGNAITLPTQDSQLSRGEPLSDTARVVSRYSDVIVLRTFSEARFREFAASSSVPVINGLTDEGHPVQLLTDLFTIEEKLGSVFGRTIAFVGDGASNMGRSFVEAAGLFGFHLRLAAPLGFRPPPALLEKANGWVTLCDSPQQAVVGAEVVVTDVWTSMGQEQEAKARKSAFEGYCVDGALMSHAPSALVLHCLPAHRGEEISAEVLEGPQSVVWDEAENRMHVQKALLEKLVFENERALAVPTPIAKARRVRRAV